jgi:hypothetical protein
MSNELDSLLQALININEKERLNKVQNSKETWSLIGAGRWADAGFTSEEELKQFLADNPYSNI